ncbi:hypothetical protein [Priestia koreensis]|uniref:hypothetical protein n=1 Tax=Priestia koreensis TaxID=284581 RepID=UPI00301AC162
MFRKTPSGQPIHIEFNSHVEVTVQNGDKSVIPDIQKTVKKQVQEQIEELFGKLTYLYETGVVR